MYVMNILLDIVCLQLFLGLGELQPEGTMIPVYTYFITKLYIYFRYTHTYILGGSFGRALDYKDGFSHILAPVLLYQSTTVGFEYALPCFPPSCSVACSGNRWQQPTTHIGVDSAEEVPEDLKLTVPPPHLVADLLALVVRAHGCASSRQLFTGQTVQVCICVCVYSVDAAC